MKYIKVRDVKDPIRANATDSGIDFFIPNDLDISDVIYTPKDKILRTRSLWEKWQIYVLPWEWVLIPSGIKMIIPDGNDLVFQDKSWVATKYGLIVWAKVVDASYRWEVHLHLINTSHEVAILELWQKIAQGIIRKVQLFSQEQITTQEFEKECNTNRGEGWFWSTWEQ